VADEAAPPDRRVPEKAVSAPNDET
jgi:hypothetical protein